MQGHDRRKYPRLEGHFRVDLLNMGDDSSIPAWEAVVEGEALDVSMQGMRLKAYYNVPVGTVLSVVIYHRGYESICLCEVVWKKEAMGEMVYGLYFKEWSKLDPLLASSLRAMEDEGSPARSAPGSSSMATTMGVA